MNYSFHWQNSNKQLIIRWDNVPHHKQIKTFPHHKHVGSKNNIEESWDIKLKDILEIIEKMIEKNDETR